jgi:hypothetical protein
MRGRVYMRDVSKRVARSRQWKQASHRAAARRLRQNKLLLLSEFENHPVTKEIQDGASAGNESGTLGGYGNLYTYIGFSSGDNPTGRLRNLIAGTIALVSRHSARSRIKPGGRGIYVPIRVRIPSITQIAAASPLPWEPGRSWAMGIETGISGFGNYMNKAFINSRSGAGLQSKHKVREGGFRPRSYLKAMLTKFLARLAT